MQLQHELLMASKFAANIYRCAAATAAWWAELVVGLGKRGEKDRDRVQVRRVYTQATPFFLPVSYFLVCIYLAQRHRRSSSSSSASVFLSCIYTLTQIHMHQKLLHTHFALQAQANFIFVCTQLFPMSIFLLVFALLCVEFQLFMLHFFFLQLMNFAFTALFHCGISTQYQIFQLHTFGVVGGVGVENVE